MNYPSIVQGQTSSCYFLPTQLVPFPSIPLGQFLNCHWCSQILSLSGFICKFNYEAMPRLASFIPWYKRFIMHPCSTKAPMGSKDILDMQFCSCMKMKSLKGTRWACVHSPAEYPHLISIPSEDVFRFLPTEDYSCEHKHVRNGCSSRKETEAERKLRIRTVLGNSH